MKITTKIVHSPKYGYGIDFAYLAENEAGVEWASMGKSFPTLLEAEAAVAGIKTLAFIAPDVKWNYDEEKWVDETK